MLRECLECGLLGTDSRIWIHRLGPNIRENDGYCEVIVRRGQEACKRLFFVVHPENKRPSGGAPVDWDDPSMLFVADFQTATIVGALEHLFQNCSDILIMEDCEAPPEFDAGINVQPIQVTEVEHQRATDKVCVNIRNSIQILYVSGICKDELEIEEYLMGQVRALLQ